MSSSKKGITCSNCGSSYLTSYIFCPNCRSHLTLPTKLNVEDVSYKQNIEQRYFEKYDELNQKIDNLAWIDDKKEELERLKKGFELDVNRLTLDIETATNEIEQRKAEIDKLESMSWTSIKAKISGNHQEELEKLKKDLSIQEDKLENATTEREKYKGRIITTQEELVDIKAKEDKRKQIESMVTDLVFQASEGIKDPEEDKLEMQINQLAQLIDPLTIRKSRIQTGYSMLQMSAEFIREAMISMEEEGEKVAKQNALLIDTLTKSDVAELRNVVKEASTYLNQAYEIMQTQLEGQQIEEGQGSGLFQGQKLWETFIRNFMKDMKKGFRSRNETKEQLSRAVGDINKLQSWVKSLLSEINYKIEELMDKLRHLEQDLIKERRRVFREHYHNYKGNNQQETNIKQNQMDGFL